MSEIEPTVAHSSVSVNSDAHNFASRGISSLLNDANSQNAILQLFQIAEESARRQMYQLWLTQEDKVFLESKFVRQIGTFIALLEPNEGYGAHDSQTHGYLETPDMGDDEVSEFRENTLFDPKLTHIYLYISRIRNKWELIITLNHEINHLFLRYSVLKHAAFVKGSNTLMVTEGNRFKVVLECFGFLSWAEASVVSGASTFFDWIRLAWGGSNGDVSDVYTVASLMAQRLLLIQKSFGDAVWSNHPDFIEFCLQMRGNLRHAIYRKSKFDSLVRLLKLDTGENFAVTTDVQSKALDWVGQ